MASRLAAEPDVFESAARRNAEGCDEVDVEHGLKLLVGGFLDDGVPGVAGVVDDDVNGAEGVEGGVDKCGGSGGVGEVSAEVPDAGVGVVGAAEGGFGFEQGGLVEVVEHDVGSGGEQALGDGAADAAS